MSVEPTKYYDNYLRYHKLAEQQQKDCNLGHTPHQEWDGGDDLLCQVELYDVVERKYAGFSQMVNDVFYADTDDHPYIEKIRRGNTSAQRLALAPMWRGKHSDFKLPEWLYIFMVHRLTGSAINYAQKPSGYHNSIVPHFFKDRTIEEMVTRINSGKHDPFLSLIHI